MTTPLFLSSLEVHQFRTFHLLRIERLARVNLIVGKNNVGKSSLLEAMWLYAYRGSPLIIWQILEARDEGNRPGFSSEQEGITEQVLPIKYLFHGRVDIRQSVEPIRIGPIASLDNTLEVAVRWYTVQVAEDGIRELRPLNGDPDAIDNAVLGLAIRMGTQPEAVVRLDRSYSRRVQVASLEATGIRCTFTSANGLSMTQIGQLWDSITLTDLEQDVLASLRLIAPEVERVNLVNNPYRGRERERIVMVKIAGLSDPIPLRNLGEGMNRMFGLALALASAKEGILLIDEIESGLHYSVQTDIWRLIFQFARRLNIQVFATTHSWDCIEAFQKSAQENKPGEGLLIRLENKRGNIGATLFDEQKLGIATREQIEVR